MEITFNPVERRLNATPPTCGKSTDVVLHQGLLAIRQRELQQAHLPVKPPATAAYPQVQGYADAFTPVKAAFALYGDEIGQVFTLQHRSFSAGSRAQPAFLQAKS